MAENLFFMGNFAQPSTANPTPSTLPAAVNVCLQLAASSTKEVCLVEYGISFSGSPAAVPVTLRQTSSAATLTTAGVIFSYNSPNYNSSVLTASTSTCAFSNSATAISPAATVAQMFDAQLLTTNTYVKQFPLGREPVVTHSTYLQLVVTAGTAATSYCYFIWRE